MGAELAYLGIVPASLTLLVVIPFLPIGYLLFRGQGWPTILLAALVLGTSLQAMTGLLWTHLVPARPLFEIVALALIWLVLLIWSLQQAGRSKVVMWDVEDEPRQTGLVAILLAGFAIRAVHPLQVAYLGQSDAYTHLNYIHNIIDFGYLINPVYPPGYHWVMALPSIVFSVDPYQAARFGGAFFGLGLILAIYVLLDRTVSRQAALFGSFCAASFPGMTLLMKTGVGAFANQFGLLLLPAVIFFYTLVVNGRSWRSGSALLLAAALGGMAVSVPMMLLHVLLVIALERLLMLVRSRRQWAGKTLRVTLLLLPALLLFAFHLGQVGGGQRYGTAAMMTLYNDKKVTTVERLAEKVERKIVSAGPQAEKSFALVVSSPYFDLISDYLSIKRRGFGNGRLDLLAGALAGLFLLLTIIGIVREGTSYLVIGLWGLITSLQAATGLLQFSSYQREGWSLLIAVCCLSGIIVAAVYRLGEGYIIFRSVVFSSLVASFCWSMARPPLHVPIRSSAEDELVRTIRQLGKGPGYLLEECRRERGGSAICSIAGLVDEDLDLVLVTRRFVGWGNQGEIALNVLPRGSGLEVKVIDGKTTGAVFLPGKQYVALVDRQGRLSSQQVTSAFAMVTPSMVEATVKNRDRLMRLNDTILQQLYAIADSSWQVTPVEISDQLSAYVVVPSD